jgi:hypothetical protein
MHPLSLQHYCKLYIRFLTYEIAAPIQKRAIDHSHFENKTY